MPTTSKPENAQLLAAAQLAADAAAAFLADQEGRMKPADWSSKGRSDFVTEVDREAERIITQVLTQAVPESVVLGEELNPTLTTHDSRLTTHGIIWIVDPLDGTTNFLHRYPEYAVSIGVVQGGQLAAGCVHHVPMNVRFTATSGGGAFMNGERLSVSTITEPQQALIGTGFPFRDIAHLDLYQRQMAAMMKNTAGIRRAGSAALDLCDVAAGRFEGFWEISLSPWDVAAGVLMVREAGGVVTTLEGGTHDVTKPESILAASPTIHAWMLETFRNL